MKAKQTFLLTWGLALSAATALSGCVKDRHASADSCQMKFVVNASMPDSGDPATRALKPGWTSGDKIVVLFDESPTQYAFFSYDGTTWAPYNNIVSTTGISSSGGSLQAIHAGSPTFDFDGTTMTGIGGDILYDQAGGTYTVDAGTNTAYINLTMERGFTTAIKMQGSADQATNEKWRLAGTKLWVMGTTTSQTAVNMSTNPEWSIQTLFVQSDASTGVVAVPDATFTDGTQAVFHVWDQSDALDGTSVDVYSTDAATVIYERDYTGDLVVGSTTVIRSPDSSDDAANWINTSLTPVNSTAVALTGVTAPAGGATPASSVTSASSEFTAAIAWNPTDAPFVAGTAYTATVTLTAATGYTFTGSGFTDAASAAGFTAGGQAPATATNNGGTLVLTYAFPAAPASLITAAALTGIVVPETGATPATTINTASTQFTAALAWSPADTAYAAATVYTATITLTAATNYTFTGDFANTASIAAFTVNGAAPTSWVSNNGTTLVFTYAFPTTSTNTVGYGPSGDDVTLN